MRLGAWRIAAALAIAPWLAGAGGDGPDDYAVRIPVTPAPGGGIQRLAVPARALVASRAANLADVRVFDAVGRAMPIAWGTPDADRARRTIRLPALPILGASGALTVTGVSLKVEDGRARVVKVEGTPATPGSTLLGVLFDTRGIADPVDRLTLDADLPRGQPVALTIETSDDLADWQPVATKTFYRAGAGGGETVAFPPTTLSGRYVRVAWDAARLVSPVAVRAATFSAIGPADGAAWPRAVIGGAAADGAHAVDFTIPFAARAVALEVAATGGDTVVPVRILGRSDAERPWTPLASGTVYRVTEAGRIRRNPPFALSNASPAMRIEADARTPGFPAMPVIAVRLAPATLLFLAGGAPPFTLAAGRAGAADVALPAASLVPGHDATVEAALPRAATPAAPDPVVEAAPSTQEGRRGALLWAILLGGTALLAAMVWRLLRQRASTTPA